MIYMLDTRHKFYCVAVSQSANYWLTHLSIRENSKIYSKIRSRHRMHKRYVGLMHPVSASTGDSEWRRWHFSSLSYLPTICTNGRQCTQSAAFNRAPFSRKNQTRSLPSSSRLKSHLLANYCTNYVRLALSSYFCLPVQDAVPPPPLPQLNAQLTPGELRNINQAYMSTMEKRINHCRLIAPKWHTCTLWATVKLETDPRD